MAYSNQKQQELFPLTKSDNPQENQTLTPERIKCLLSEFLAKGGSIKSDFQDYILHHMKPVAPQGYAVNLSDEEIDAIIAEDEKNPKVSQTGKTDDAQLVRENEMRDRPED